MDPGLFLGFAMLVVIALAGLAPLALIGISEWLDARRRKRKAG